MLVFNLRAGQGFLCVCGFFFCFFLFFVFCFLLLFFFLGGGGGGVQKPVDDSAPGQCTAINAWQY